MSPRARAVEAGDRIVIDGSAGGRDGGRTGDRLLDDRDALARGSGAGHTD